MSSASSHPRRDQFAARVTANIPLCREHFRLILEMNSFPATEPGQFVQLACRDLQQEAQEFADVEIEIASDRWPAMRGAELCDPLAYLRRPFSLAGRRDTNGRTQIDIIHRVVGAGTTWLAKLSPGDTVDVLGPLGNRFMLPAADQTALLVGGGVGIPPMLYLAEKLKNYRAIAFIGATTRDLLPLTLTGEPHPSDVRPMQSVAEFAASGVDAVVTTDDGSCGLRGFVTEALQRWLDMADLTSPPIIYTCGPELMMKRVAQIVLDRDLPCQVAVERAMACGMGTCQSCCIRIRKPDPSQPPLAGSDWCWRLACTDGPIFTAAELLW